jgi:peptidylprolyl isomerase
MRSARHGDTVKVQYRGQLRDGSVFDASLEGEPLQFTIGKGEIMAGFEEAVVGMNPGEAKTADIPAEKAFGPYYEDMVVVVQKSDFPENVQPKVGQTLPISRSDGPAIDVTVTEVTESEVTLDANHPLAGEDLRFEIELIDIVYGAH